MELIIMNNKTYYELSKMSKEEIFNLFNTKESGLSSSVSSKRLQEYGKNIPSNNKETSIEILLNKIDKFFENSKSFISIK